MLWLYSNMTKTRYIPHLSRIPSHLSSAETSPQTVPEKQPSEQQWGHTLGAEATQTIITNILLSLSSSHRAHWADREECILTTTAGEINACNKVSSDQQSLKYNLSTCGYTTIWVKQHVGMTVHVSHDSSEAANHHKNSATYRNRRSVLVTKSGPLIEYSLEGLLRGRDWGGARWVSLGWSSHTYKVIKIHIFTWQYKLPGCGGCCEG